MKNIRNLRLKGLLVICTTILTAISFSACTDDFDRYNTDPDKPREEDLGKDNLWGSFLTTMQRNVIPEDINTFQLTEDLFGNVYAGYMSSMNNWEAGMNSTTYVFPAGWVNTPFRAAYVDFLSSWNVLRQKVDSTSILFAVGEVLKVQTMHRVTDMYGPLPYKKYGLISPVPYDSQEEIYKSFFEELDHSIRIMTAFDSQSPGSTALLNYDLVYASNIPNWIRYANSLKLRLAMRIRYVEPDMARTYAEAAVNNSYGLIISNDMNPTMRSNTAFGFNYQNPIECLWNEYGDQCMGATMESYLSGYNDPRLSKYFQPTISGTYKGLRNGFSDGTIFRSQPLSDPRIFYADAMRWMTASEIAFLRAEGALMNWDMGGSAQFFYEQGIRLSFELWGVTDNTAIENYIVNSTNQPTNYVGLFGIGSIQAPSTITIQWNELSTKDQKLERIMTQKWIAMYPLGQEAWSEYRRTGYPNIFPVIDNKSNGNVDTSIQVRRLPFPESEYSGNNTEVNKAIQMLKGSDIGGTRLWWDIENKSIN